MSPRSNHDKDSTEKDITKKAWYRVLGTKTTKHKVEPWFDSNRGRELGEKV